MRLILVSLLVFGTVTAFGQDNYSSHPANISKCTKVTEIVDVFTGSRKHEKEVVTGYTLSWSVCVETEDGYEVRAEESASFEKSKSRRAQAKAIGSCKTARNNLLIEQSHYLDEYDLEKSPCDDLADDL